MSFWQVAENPAPKAGIRRCAAFENDHLLPEQAALSKTPHAPADGPMLVFRTPAGLL
jgi:hypothetical protein